MPLIPIQSLLHNGVDGEINALTEKSTLVDGDVVLIEDSEDSYSRKKVLVSNLPGDGGGGGGGNASYAETIGDNSNTSYQVTHDLGTQDIIVQLWDLTGSDPVEATGDAASITIDDDDNITVAFSAAPAVDSYRVVVVSDGGGGGGDASTPYVRMRLMAQVNNANTQMALNTTSFIQIGQTDFYFDWDLFPATHFRMSCFGHANVSGQTVTFQLAAISAPATPFSASGDDFVVTNGLSSRTTDWIAVSGSPTGRIYMGAVAKGSNSTVDFDGRWFDIEFKIDP